MHNEGSTGAKDEVSVSDSSASSTLSGIRRRRWNKPVLSSSSAAAEAADLGPSFVALPLAQGIKEEAKESTAMPPKVFIGDADDDGKSGDEYEKGFWGDGYANKQDNVPQGLQDNTKGESDSDATIGVPDKFEEEVKISYGKAPEKRELRRRVRSASGSPAPSGGRGRSGPRPMDMMISSGSPMK